MVVDDQQTKANMKASNRADDPRSIARQLAIQVLHQLSVQQGRNIGQIEHFLKEFTPDEKARIYARRWSKGAWDNLEQIDEYIGRFSSNWELKRINLVDRSNLRLAVYQLLYCREIPAKVVINEAIELAKVFSSAQAPGFINGLLDVIQKSIAKEFPRD